jgi:hypothetical protein
MIWVGSFRSLQTVLGAHRFTGTPLDVHTWVRSEIALISPLVDWLMNLIATSQCVCGEEQLVELALREALSNAMLHGNRKPRCRTRARHPRNETGYGRSFL